MGKFEGMFRFVEPSGRFLRHVWHEMSEDNVMGVAAQMAFFFTMALFPFFILLAALAGMPVDARPQVGHAVPARVIAEFRLQYGSRPHLRADEIPLFRRV
jgi:hypothetical protein